jgi:hypothetical protein
LRRSPGGRSYGVTHSLRAVDVGVNALVVLACLPEPDEIRSAFADYDERGCQGHRWAHRKSFHCCNPFQFDGRNKETINPFFRNQGCGVIRLMTPPCEFVRVPASTKNLSAADANFREQQTPV